MAPSIENGDKKKRKRQNKEEDEEYLDDVSDESSSKKQASTPRRKKKLGKVPTDHNEDEEPQAATMTAMEAESSINPSSESSLGNAALSSTVGHNSLQRNQEPFGTSHSPLLQSLKVSNTSSRMPRHSTLSAREGSPQAQQFQDPSSQIALAHATSGSLVADQTVAPPSTGQYEEEAVMEEEEDEDNEERILNGDVSPQDLFAFPSTTQSSSPSWIQHIVPSSCQLPLSSHKGEQEQKQRQKFLEGILDDSHQYGVDEWSRFSSLDFSAEHTHHDCLSC